MGGTRTPYIGPYIITEADLNDAIDELDIDSFIWCPEYLQAFDRSGNVWISNGGHQISIEDDVMFNESVVRHNMANLIQSFKNTDEYKKLEKHLVDNDIEYEFGFGFCTYYN